MLMLTTCQITQIAAEVSGGGWVCACGCAWVGCRWWVVSVGKGGWVWYGSGCGYVCGCGCGCWRDPSFLACLLASFLPCGVGMGIGVVVVVSECVFMCRSAMGSSKWHWIHWRVPRLTPPCYF